MNGVSQFAHTESKKISKNLNGVIGATHLMTMQLSKDIPIVDVKQSFVHILTHLLNNYEMMDC